MINNRTKYYVISFISKFNLLFLVTLVMLKKKNEKKQTKTTKKKNEKKKNLTCCLDKKIQNYIKSTVLTIAFTKS